MKNLLFGLITALSLTSPVVAQSSSPGIAYRAFETPYGTFGCMQRGELKLYSMGATGVTKSNTSVFGTVVSSKVAVWCRGSEGVIIVTGYNDNAQIRDEVYTAF